MRVTEPYLPPIAEYQKLVGEILERNWLTNNGPVLQEFEQQLSDRMDGCEVVVVSNGTQALQLANRAIGFTGGKVITTAYSYRATLTSLLWEGAQPVFVDVLENGFTPDLSQVEAAIDEGVKGMLFTHCYGFACDVEEIQALADHHGIPVMYDGAHAFGSIYKGKPLLTYGDAAGCSFHATKLFHSVEGGAVITRNPDLAEKLRYMRHFGQDENTDQNLRTNVKMSELHAAMGLLNLQYFDETLITRKRQVAIYSELLQPVSHRVVLPTASEDLDWNGAYYPILFEDESTCIHVRQVLSAAGIESRRYFRPALNLLLKDAPTMTRSQSVSDRVLCLPLFHSLSEPNQARVVNELINSLKQ